jgi:hypothetical protein
VFLGINLVLVKLVLFDVLVYGINTNLSLHKAEVASSRGRSLEPRELRILLLRNILHLHVGIRLLTLA